jgi:hypothetical protein
MLLISLMLISQLAGFNLHAAAEYTAFTHLHAPTSDEYGAQVKHAAAHAPPHQRTVLTPPRSAHTDLQSAHTDLQPAITSVACSQVRGGRAARPGCARDALGGQLTQSACMHNIR